MRRHRCCDVAIRTVNIYNLHGGGRQGVKQRLHASCPQCGIVCIHPTVPHTPARMLESATPHVAAKAAKHPRPRPPPHTASYASHPKRAATRSVSQRTRDDAQHHGQRTVAHKLVELCSTRQGRCNCRRVVGCQLAAYTRKKHSKHQTWCAHNEERTHSHIAWRHDHKCTSPHAHTGTA